MKGRFIASYDRNQFPGPAAQMGWLWPDPKAVPGVGAEHGAGDQFGTANSVRRWFRHREEDRRKTSLTTRLSYYILELASPSGGGADRLREVGSGRTRRQARPPIASPAVLSNEIHLRPRLKILSQNDERMGVQNTSGDQA